MRFIKYLFAAIFPFIMLTAFAGYSNLIVFGDSLSDVGNNPDAPFTNPNAAGNRPIWVNGLADALFPGKKVYASSKLINNAYTSPRNENISYAWGCAVAGLQSFTRNNTKFWNCNVVHNVSEQINTFLQDVQNEPNPNSLYIVWVGGNDLFAMLAKQMGIGKTVYSARDMHQLATLVDAPVNSVGASVKKLIDYGVPTDHIFVMNVPDVSHTPAIHLLTGNNQALVDQVSALSKLFNAQLSGKLAALLPESHMILEDDFLGKIINHPVEYGFSNVKGACNLLGKMPDCQGFFFFDLIHPARGAQSLTAQLVKQDIESVH